VGYSYNACVTAKNALNPEASKNQIHGRGAVGAFAVIGLIFAGVLLMRGQGGAWSSRAAVVLLTLLESGWSPLLYLLGALGLGRVVRTWVCEIPARWVIELGVGLTLTMWVTHLLGIGSMLNPVTAWGITGIGLVMLVPDLKRARAWDASSLTLTPIRVVIMCGAVLALIMACSPPGLLWGSEYGGFDALSYHLQLPREWIEQGHIWPSEHNVYSFLPGFVEGAYMHIALLMGGGMHTNGAQAAMSAQLLSAMMLIVSAGMIGALTCDCMKRLMPDADSRTSAMLGTALTLGTPWLLVVGTLAYNEIAVVLLGASALHLAIQTDIKAWKRAVLCGLIVGGASSCKPTALFLLAPTVGIVLLASMPNRHWVVATLLCCVLGALTISPWLIRNAIETGNPVFPQMQSVFGGGHWNESQHAIYESAHAFDGTILDRFAMLVLPDTGESDHVARFRGFTNGQWGLTPLLGLIGLVSLLMTRTTRRAGVVACLALCAPTVAWAMLTHLQSRFLIPQAPMLIVLGAMGIARIVNEPLRRTLSRVLSLFVLMWCIGLSLVQIQGNPFLVLDLGPALSIGGIEINEAPWTATLNQLTNEGDTVYLLGDATPFYVTGDVRYNTVYDRWLIEDAIERSPADPAHWTRSLRAMGVDFVVVSFSEIQRYANSAWLPDSIDIDQLIVWIDSLGEPIQVWSDPNGVPLRAIFRISDPNS